MASSSSSSAPAAAASSSAPAADRGKAPAVEAKEEKMISVRSEDGEVFEIDEAVAMQSQTIRHMIEDDCADATIPIPNVRGEVFSEVFEYCQRHAVPVDDDDVEGWKAMKAWNADYIEGMDINELIEVMLAANYLDIKGLLELILRAVADRIKDKTTEQVREIFNIENDFTEEEEKKVRQDNAWAWE